MRSALRLSVRYSMNFWRRGVGWEWIFVIARSLELLALPCALNRPPRAAASFNEVTRANAGGARRLQIRALRAARIAQFNRSAAKAFRDPQVKGWKGIDLHSIYTVA